MDMGFGEGITVVSGIPRSGTSMMMQMLGAGGMPLLVDGARPADEDNPEGYFEFEPVARLALDSSWLKLARGRAVKVISQFLLGLPVSGAYSYDVVFMSRNVDQVMASQRRMMQRRGTYRPELLDERTPSRFAAHCELVIGWLNDHPCFNWVAIDYGEALLDPMSVAVRVNRLLGGGLDVAAMVRVPTANLSHHREDDR